MLGDVGLDECMEFVAPHFNGRCPFYALGDMVGCLIHRVGPSAEYYVHGIRTNFPGHASSTQERTLCTSHREIKVTIYDLTKECLRTQPYRFSMGYCPRTPRNAF